MRWHIFFIDEWVYESVEPNIISAVYDALRSTGRNVNTILKVVKR